MACEPAPAVFAPVPAPTLSERRPRWLHQWHATASTATLAHASVAPSCRRPSPIIAVAPRSARARCQGSQAASNAFLLQRGARVRAGETCARSAADSSRARPDTWPSSAATRAQAGACPGFGGLRGPMKEPRGRACAHAAAELPLTRDAPLLLAPPQNPASGPDAPLLLPPPPSSSHAPPRRASLPSTISSGGISFSAAVPPSLHPECARDTPA